MDDGKAVSNHHATDQHPIVGLARYLNEQGATGIYRRRQWTGNRLLMKFNLPAGAPWMEIGERCDRVPGVRVSNLVPDQIALLVVAGLADRLEPSGRPALPATTTKARALPPER